MLSVGNKYSYPVVETRESFWKLLQYGADMLLCSAVFYF